MRFVLGLFTVLLMTACSNDPYHGLYDGLKSNSDAKRTPNERAVAPAPSYEEYKKEREAKPKE